MQMTLGEIPLEEMKEVWYGESFGYKFKVPEGGYFIRLRALHY